MKINKNIVWSFILLVLTAAIYRIVPGRPPGFAPQIAMALFAGSVINEKKYSFLFPLLSMLVSDVLYEILYSNGIGNIKGFYSGQISNYLLFVGLTVIGFWVKKSNIPQIIGGSLVAATVYFIVSNFMVWIGGGLGLNNLPYAKNWAGLTECLAAGLPFYVTSILATLTFSGILFGAYYLIQNIVSKKGIA